MDGILQQAPEILKLLGALKQAKEPKGLSSLVVTNEGSTINKDAAPSDTTQKKEQLAFIELLGKTLGIGKYTDLKKYKAIADIFAQEFQVGKYKPKEIEVLPQTPKMVLPAERRPEQPVVQQQTNPQSSLLGDLAKVVGGIALVIGGAILSLMSGPDSILGRLGLIASKIGQVIFELSVAGFKRLSMLAADLFKPLLTGATFVFEKIAKFGSEFTKKLSGFATKLTENVFEGGLKQVTKILPTTTGLFSNVLTAAGKLVKGIFKGGLKALKFVPFLGAFVNLYFAYQKYKAGDWIGGTLELASGLVDFIPGIGPIISIGIDLISLFRDVTMSKQSRVEQSSSVLGSIGGWIGNVSKMVWDAVSNFFMGIFSPVKSAFDWVMNKLTVDGTETNNDKGVIASVVDWVSNVGQKIWGAVSGFFTNIFTPVKSAFSGIVTKLTMGVDGDQIKEFFNGIGEWVDNISGMMWGAIKSFFGSIKSPVTKSVNWIIGKFSNAENTPAPGTGAESMTSSEIAKNYLASEKMQNNNAEYFKNQGIQNESNRSNIESGLFLQNNSKLKLNLDETNTILSDQIKLQQLQVSLAEKTVELLRDLKLSAGSQTNTVTKSESPWQEKYTFKGIRDSFTQSPYYA